MRSLAGVVEELIEGLPLWRPKGKDQPFVDRGGINQNFGAFFEHVGARVLGGKVLHRRGFRLEPQADIYDGKRGVEGDAKSSVSGHHTIFVADQFDRYCTKNESIPLEYLVFRHTVRGAPQFDVRKAHALAAASPKLLVVIPHSIVERAVEAGKPFNSDYQWGPLLCHTLSSTFVNGLALDTENWLQKLGLEPEGYGWEQHRTPRMKVIGYTVPPFPFTYIQEKN